MRCKMSDLKKSIGEKIVIARKTKGLSQAALAKKVNIYQQALSAYERGQASISLALFLDICNVLEAPLSWFLPNVKQYGNIVEQEDIELLIKLREFTDTKPLLDFIKSIRFKQSNGKKQHCNSNSQKKK